MSKSWLSAEKKILFHEMVWRLMGNLQDSHWRDMLDPHSVLGRWIRERYEQLAIDAGDEAASLLVQDAQVDLFVDNVHPLAPPAGGPPAGG